MDDDGQVWRKVTISIRHYIQHAPTWQLFVLATLYLLIGLRLMGWLFSIGLGAGLAGALLFAGSLILIYHLAE